METNPILAEIRNARDELARETGGDVERLMALLRKREEEDRAQGAAYAQPGGAARLAEDAPPFRQD